MSTLNAYFHKESGIRLFTEGVIYPDMLAGLTKIKGQTKDGFFKDAWVSSWYTGEDYDIYVEKLEDIPKLCDILDHSQFSAPHNICVSREFFNKTLELGRT